MKDHEIAALVNDLASIAREFGQTQQLRERISQRVRVALSEPVDMSLPICDCEAGFCNSASRVRCRPSFDDDYTPEFHEVVLAAQRLAARQKPIPPDMAAVLAANSWDLFAR